MCVMNPIFGEIALSWCTVERTLKCYVFIAHIKKIDVDVDFLAYVGYFKRNLIWALLREQIVSMAKFSAKRNYFHIHDPGNLFLTVHGQTQTKFFFVNFNQITRFQHKGSVSSTSWRNLPPLTWSFCAVLTQQNLETQSRTEWKLSISTIY